MLGGPERDEFFAKAQPWLDGRTVADIVELSQAMRIPAAPVNDGATDLDCPQYAAPQASSSTLAEASGASGDRALRSCRRTPGNARTARFASGQSGLIIATTLGRPTATDAAVRRA